MKYKIRDRTPEELRCAIGLCPAIYDVKELTPKEMVRCIGAFCPTIYKTKEEVYLIVGKLVNPSDVGLEKKVGENETLIEVPKALIDKMKRE